MANNYSHLFPNLISRSRLCRRLKGLLRAMEIIRQNLLFLLNADLTSIRIVDNFPLPLCHLKRLSRSTCPFEYLANVGRCESKGETYYGVKVHIMATLSGIPVGYCITPASTHNTKCLIALLADTPNLLGITILGDKGYAGKELHELVLQQFEVTMLVQQRCYNKELPESVAMHAGQNLTRSVTGLMLQLKAKFTAFNLANYLNVLLDEPILQVASF
ncbi:MAG: IS982 family transposase [Candidatus Schekmanbacteria bacterium]|nr:IS982 family transposase [Candidatus Schekmanbacteria bacterium]